MIEGFINGVTPTWWKYVLNNRDREVREWAFQLYKSLPSDIRQFVLETYDVNERELKGSKREELIKGIRRVEQTIKEIDNKNNIDRGIKK